MSRNKKEERIRKKKEKKRKKEEKRFKEEVITDSANSKLEMTDIAFTIKFNEAKIIDRGEDADPLQFKVNNCHLLCVFDGLGGAGSQLLNIQGQNKTSAYHASRQVSKITEEFFNKHISISSEFNSEFFKEFENKLFTDLKKFNDSVKRDSKLKSSLIKALPTTISGFILELKEDEKVYCHNFWAGDSRNYILNEKGLNQLTKDDLQEDYDALQNINGDSKMSNFVNADKPFVINCSTREVALPSILFSVTDGAYDYLPTPMDFEYLLLTCIENSTSFEEFKTMLINELIKIPVGDDVSASFIFYGWASYDSMKDELAFRLHKLSKQFMGKSLEENNNIEESRFELNQLKMLISKKENILKQLREDYWKEYKVYYHS